MSASTAVMICALSVPGFDSKLGQHQQAVIAYRTCIIVLRFLTSVRWPWRLTFSTENLHTAYSCPEKSFHQFSSFCLYFFEIGLGVYDFRQTAGYWSCLTFIDLELIIIFAGALFFFGVEGGWHVKTDLAWCFRHSQLYIHDRPISPALSWIDVLWK